MNRLIPIVASIELAMECNCGARVSSMGISRARLPQLMAAFDASHTEECRAEPLFEPVPGTTVKWAGETETYTYPDDEASS